MNHPSPIPCAQSEPISVADAVVSALLWRAGELLELLEGREQTPCRSPMHSPTPLQTGLGNLLTLVEQDGELARLLEELPQALGSGLLLQAAFARLFPAPPQPMASLLPPGESPLLEPRELEVLREMARGRFQKEIPRYLSPTKSGQPVQVSTVRKHVANILKKLDAECSQEAVAKAAALGLLPFDFADLVSTLQDRWDLDFNPFAYPFLGGVGAMQREGEAETLRQLASLGLFLFLLSPAAAAVRGEHAPGQRFQGKGRLFEFTPDGHFVHTFDNEGSLRYPVALAFAPPAAERHGFTPGHLFVVNWGTNSDPLNCSSITELTSDGRSIRTFTGGVYLSTRLHYSSGSAFTLDGRLLVTSAALTDAVLEFTQGGRAVRRFASLVPYGGLTVDARGQVYVIGGWSRDSSVHVFNPQGERLRTVGKAKADEYQGVAVDEEGRLYVSNWQDHLIEVYDAGGNRLGSLSGGGLSHPHKSAFGPCGRLYVLDGGDQTVKVFSPNGGPLFFSFPAPSGAQLHGLTFGPNGNLFVAGLAVHE